MKLGIIILLALVSCHEPRRGYWQEYSSQECLDKCNADCSRSIGCAPKNNRCIANDKEAYRLCFEACIDACNTKGGK